VRLPAMKWETVDGEVDMGRLGWVGGVITGPIV
jgi:hypothetical protein